MEYKTTDIYLTTILLTKGALLSDVEVDDGLRRQAVFVLDPQNLKLEAIIQAYNNRDLQIEAHTFVDTFKVLKQKMYEKLNTR